MRKLGVMPAVVTAVLCVAVINCAEARQRTHRHTIGSVLDANGNTALSVVRSSKTGARASVLRRYAAAFQGYVDELEANGAIIRFMGGIRPGRCASRSLHPCGMALDICQMARGRVDRRCRLPGRERIARIARRHNLFEGGQWCHSDYGHVQAKVTAAACRLSDVASARRRRH